MMKLKPIVLLFFLSLFAASSSAQPGCNAPVNPFFACMNQTLISDDYLFFGEIVSMERLENDDVKVSGKWVSQRVVIKVKRSLKGNLSKEVTLYIGYDVICSGLARKGKYLFNASLADMGGRNVLLYERASFPMTDYSPKTVRQLLDNLESILASKNKESLNGVIYESFSNVRPGSAKSEQADKLVPDPELDQPLANILIDIIDKENGKIYQTKSDSKGRFVVEKIPNGSYTIKAHLPRDKYQASYLDTDIDESVCSRNWHLIVRSKKGT